MKHLRNIENKILSDEKFDFWLKNKRQQIPKLVFTNGCFDIIHRGHIIYLSKAADLGSHFIVAINTDKSVKKIKGESRPLQDQYTRALVVAAFEFVSYVVFFDTDTPAHIIQQIVPDVLVKGGDYKPENIIGYNTVTRAGGEVRTMDFIQGYSSSKIFDSI
jgi:D-glycero-beta-D-manno-heptose 1-phosphate adenylyltransferase